VKDTPRLLKDLGLDSFALLSFLVAVEDEFGIVWDDEVPDEVLGSIDTITAYIEEQLGLVDENKVNDAASTDHHLSQQP
jgi:acyl carrier protein